MNSFQIAVLSYGHVHERNFLAQFLVGYAHTLSDCQWCVQPKSLQGQKSLTSRKTVIWSFVWQSRSLRTSPWWKLADYSVCNTHSIHSRDLFVWKPDPPKHLSKQPGITRLDVGKMERPREMMFTNNKNWESVDVYLLTLLPMDYVNNTLV